MADISRIKLPSGNYYDIKDAAAREAIAALEGGQFFLGITTTELTDQSTTNPIVVDGENVTATNGNIAVFGNAEFIFNGTKWIEFGDLSKLGKLATKDNVNLSKGDGDDVLGDGTTFTNSTSPVSFEGGATDDFVKSYPGVKSKLEKTTVPNVESAGTASDWSFQMGSGDDANTLIIGGGNGTAPTLGTPIGVATGALKADGTGGEVMTGLGDAATGSAVTNVGTGTAAAQTITVGANDKVKVAKYDDLDVTVS